MNDSSFSVIVLAAGKGKRMHSQLAKVLYPVLFRPMIHFLLETVAKLSPRETALVVSHQKEAVTRACADRSLIFVDQETPLGTGHAVQKALPYFKEVENILVLCGDTILISVETLRGLYDAHVASLQDATVLTTHLPNPSGYGRIIKNAQGGLEKIVEEADCDKEQKSIKEINSGIYFFKKEALAKAVALLKSNNSQKELYLTDTLQILREQGKKIGFFLISNSDEILGINDREMLNEVEKKIQRRINSQWMKEGISLINPEQIRIDPASTLQPDVTIEGPAVIVNSHIGRGTYVEMGCRIQSTKIGEDNKIKQGSYLEGAHIENHVSIGPYAHLRPGSVLKSQVKIGNFVEIKKATLDEGAKASHLSYIGDAVIGARVNLGCGFITCNYDGSSEKKITIIEEDVFVGSDSQTVAPVKISKGSYIASGSTVTEDVPPESLVLTRGKQITKPGYAKKYRKK